MNIDDVKFEPESNGKAVSFRIDHNSKSFRVLISSELLDDEVGDQAEYDARESYVRKQFKDILKAGLAKIDGGFARQPFSTGVTVHKL